VSSPDSTFMYSLNFFIHVRKFLMVVYRQRRFLLWTYHLKQRSATLILCLSWIGSVVHCVLVLIKQSWQFSL